MEELISIIVPVYKVENYLSRCIHSLLTQKYTNFEVILVDDGSPDKCGDICDEYARNNERIKVIHKANGGLSDARNAGMKMAKGDYIAFVDSDDWISSEYLSFMLKALKESGGDICECEVMRTAQEISWGLEEFTILNEYATEQALGELISDGVFRQHVWNKLYKRECVENIFFPKGKTNEDEFWTYRAFGKAKKVVKISNVLYFYFQREESIMNSAYSLKRLDGLEAKQERQKYIDMKFPKLATRARNNLFTTCIYSGQMTLRFLKGTEKVQAINKISKIQFENCPNRAEIDELSGSDKLWVKLAVKNFWLVCGIKNILRKGF